MNDYEIRVNKGANLLDEHVPGWADKVDLETFLITSVDRCIIGQVFGDWGTGLSELERLSGVRFHRDYDEEGQIRKSQEGHGFELTYNEYTSEDPYVYTGQELEDAWIKQIKARQS